MAARYGLRQESLHWLLRAWSEVRRQGALPLELLRKPARAWAWQTVFVTIAVLVAVP